MRKTLTLLIIILLISMNITVMANEIYIVDDGHESYYNSPIQLMAMGDYGGNLTGATWYWPIHGYSSTSSAYSKITSSYGFRGGSYNKYHKGVDIGESLGTAVYSIRSGTVSVVDNSTGGSEGRSIIINHNDGYWSVYMHLSSINVKQGQSVTPNTKIGAVGGSGYNSESYYPKHLHLGIHYGNSFDWECNVNPCPSGYTRIGSSLQDSAGGYPIGSASIAYSVSNYVDDTEEPETEIVDSPTLSVQAGTTGTNTIFSWNAVEGASSYDLKIWKDSYLEGTAYISKTNVSSGIGISLPTGTYYAYIDACNSTMTDWKMSNIVSFKVVEMTSPTLAVKAGTANTNSTFTWNSVNGASSYNLKIWKDSYLEGSAYISKTDVASGIGISLPVGQYYAYIDACNSTMTDWKMSNIVSFKVVELASPTLTVNAGTTSSNTIFTWNAVEGASSYDLKIWKDSYLEGSAYINKTDVPSGIGISLPVGTYYAYIDACNSTMSDWKMSNIVSFKVVDAIPHITSNVKKVGNKFIVNVNLINIDISYEIIVAGYKNNKFVTMKRIPHNKQNSPYTLEGDIDKIKVMVWGNLSTLKPLCEAEEITSDKFVIE